MVSGRRPLAQPPVPPAAAPESLGPWRGRGWLRAPKPPGPGPRYQVAVHLAAAAEAPPPRRSYARGGPRAPGPAPSGEPARDFLALRGRGGPGRPGGCRGA